MPLTARPPAPPVPPTRIAPPSPPVAPRPMAPPPQRAAAPQLMAGGPAPTTTRAVQGPAGVAAAPRPVGRPPGVGVALTQPSVKAEQAMMTEDGKMSNAIRSAQLKFYTAGAAYFESQVNAVKGQQAVAARPSVSAPSVATAQKDPTPAAPGPEKRPVGRPPGRSPASPPTQQVTAPVQAAAPVAAPSTSNGEVPSADVLAGMTRKDLVTLAQSMGLETQGVKGDDLRVMIANHGGVPAVAVQEQAQDVPAENGPSANEQYMEVRATTNMQLIDDNLDKYESYLDPASTDPNALKCGGDCVRCPNPGKFPHAADQVASCYAELHSDLGLEQQYPVEVAA